MRCEIRRKGEAEVTVPEWPSLKKWLISVESLGGAIGCLYAARTAEGFGLIVWLAGAGAFTLACFDFAQEAMRER